ncbi:ApaLI family restriction endonuclease [Anaerobacillus sp. CMMVII]|nr:ApaLI family restriction endonuclease [Anaerobacillus sp. CMMVII]
MTKEEKLIEISKIVTEHRSKLQGAIENRMVEMVADSNEHYLVYGALGMPENEHALIDKYQNVGRFVYKYAGSLLERMAQIALGGEAIYITNTISSQPKQFEIDCYTEWDNKAHEIKWRDATTDGDHKNKENNKVKCIVSEGLIPVRVMFFMPERTQARKIQERIISIFKEQGEAYIGEEAFEYIKDYSGIDIKEILNEEMKSLRL